MKISAKIYQKLCKIVQKQAFKNKPFFSRINHLFRLEKKTGQNRRFNLWKCAVSGCAFFGFFQLLFFFGGGMMRFTCLSVCSRRCSIRCLSTYLHFRRPTSANWSTWRCMGAPPLGKQWSGVYMHATGFPKCYFFNTFFYAKLTENGYRYDSVKRWTRKVYKKKIRKKTNIVRKCKTRNNVKFCSFIAPSSIV